MRFKRRKVLVADCHEDVLIRLEKLLEDEGYDTATAWSAEDVLALVDSEEFDVIVVNEYMPDADCEDILRMLRVAAPAARCIVMQPSAPRITDIGLLRRLGARDVVCKYSSDDFIQAVHNCFAPYPMARVAT
jgi:CheY-like chemotaxis protein